MLKFKVDWEKQQVDHLGWFKMFKVFNPSFVFRAKILVLFSGLKPHNSMIGIVSHQLLLHVIIANS